MSEEDERATSERPSEPSRIASDPVLRIVTADATPEEVAALVAVVAALSSGTPEPPGPLRSEWNAPHRLVRSRQQHGPGGWRASSLPR